MPQELQVLRCCACESFQGHIVKKDKNWVCKICNQKQTTQMVYGRGSGKECRVIVQELNMRRLQLEETPTCKFELTKYPNADEYLTTEKNSRTSRWTEFVEFGDYNGIADAKKSIPAIINIDEIHQNITEDLVVADTRNSKLENKRTHSEHYEESPLRLHNSAANDYHQEPSKEDFQDYVCVSFKSNETVIIKHHKDWQTNTNKRIISKSDNENVKRIKLDDLDCSASSYKEKIDYSNKPAILKDKENSGNKHNIHGAILEENQKDSKTSNLIKNIKEVSIFESAHFNADDLYFF